MKNNLKKLLNENNKLEEKVSKENLEIITNIIVYIKYQGICEIDVEIIRKDIIGMALECELREESFSSVIGEYYKGFADSLMKTCTKESITKKMLNFCFIITGCMTSLFLFEYVPFIIKNKTFNISITLGFLVSVLIAIITVPLIFKHFSKNVFKSNNYEALVLLTGFCAYIALLVVTEMYLGHIMLINVSFLMVFVILIISVFSIYIITTIYTNNLLLKKQCFK